MVYMLIAEREKERLQFLKLLAKEVFAYYSEDFLSMALLQDDEERERFLQKKELLDIGFLQIRNGSDLHFTRRLRRLYQMAELLLVADEAISPMEYMTPDIRAVSLLICPFSQEQGRQVVEQFFRAFYRKECEEKDKKSMILENREGKIRIPYMQIYYIEVREKKIYVRLQNREYTRYETLEHILKELPEQFRQCHRSFIVNTAYIRRIKLSENMIYLEDDVAVPLSRSYKTAMKEYLKKR